MKFSKFTAGLFPVAILSSLSSIAMMSPASAQSVPSDVRCLMLSNVFAKQAGAEQGRQVATQTLMFFIGRLDGRADAQTITNAMRAQSAAIDPKTAGPEMTACATRLAQAQQAMQAHGRAAVPPK